jgi:hypothetical protein
MELIDTLPFQGAPLNVYINNPRCCLGPGYKGLSAQQKPLHQNI